MRHRSVVRMSENRLLVRMFVAESEEVTGGWGKLHNKGLHGLYLAMNVIGSCYSEWAVGRLIGSCYSVGCGQADWELLQ